MAQTLAREERRPHIEHGAPESENGEGQVRGNPQPAHEVAAEGHRHPDVRVVHVDQDIPRVHEEHGQLVAEADLAWWRGPMSSVSTERCRAVYTGR